MNIMVIVLLVIILGILGALLYLHIKSSAAAAPEETDVQVIYWQSEPENVRHCPGCDGENQKTAQRCRICGRMF